MASYEYKGVVVELQDPKNMALIIAKQTLEIAALKAGSAPAAEAPESLEQATEEVSLPKPVSHAEEEDAKETAWAQH